MHIIGDFTVHHSAACGDRGAPHAVPGGSSRIWDGAKQAATW